MDAAPALADGRYRLLSVLGQGGMATVYRGLDTRLEVERAVKVLDPELAKDPQLRARFEDEARTLARLHHDNLVTVHDVGAEGDRVYFVMEWVPGGSLRDKVRRDGPLPLREAARVLDGMLAGLGHAHSHGVVHRDVKPHNILLAADGSARVADFGIARASEGASGPTRTGAVMGTWAYMAPEQRTSATHADARADLYAAAATFYAALTGREPVDLHASDSHAERFRDLPMPVQQFIAQGTRYHAADRFQDAHAMREALAAVVERTGDTEALPALTPIDAPPLTNPSNTFGLSALGVDTVNPTPAPLEPPDDGTLPESTGDTLAPPTAPDAPPPRAHIPWPFIVGALLLVTTVWFVVDLAVLPAQTWHTGLLPTADGLVPLGPSTEPSHLGQSLWRVTRDDQDRPVTMVRVNGADHPWAYDADGNEIAAGYRAIYGEESIAAVDVLNEAGVAIHRMAIAQEGDTLTVRHLHPEGGTAQSAYSLDLRYPDFPGGDAPPVEVYRVDGQGRLVQGMWFDASGQPAQGPDRAWGARYTWDAQGRLIRRTALDARGNDVISAGGVVSAVWHYAADAPGPVAVHYEAFAGVPARSEAGVHRIRMGYDAEGRRDRWDFLDIDGEPIGHRDEICAGWRMSWSALTRTKRCVGIDGGPGRAGQGWAQSVHRFDGRHTLVEASKLDADGALLDGKGWARRQETHDALGRLAVRGPYFTADGSQTHVPEYGEQVSRVEASYDERGNLVELRYLDADGALVPGPDGAAIVRMTYDGTRRVEWRAYDAQSMPVVTEYGYATIVQAWDDRGYLVEVRALDANDRPVVWERGWATQISGFDDAGRPTSERYYDAEDALTLTEDGYATKTWTYEGSAIRYELRGTDGARILGTDGWAVQEEVYDARGLEVEERFFGVDGAPVPMEQGETGRTYTYNASGRMVEQGLLGETLTTPCVRTAYDWDSRGNLVRVGCRNAAGEPIPFADVDYADQRASYDRQDRQTEVTYWTANGERTDRDGCWSTTWVYDESGGRERQCVEASP